MTDADLARWEAYLEIAPEPAPAEVLIRYRFRQLIAEVRRLRADLTHERLASRGLIARIAVLEGQNVLPPTPRPHPYEERRHTRN